ncbi:hypothetical protein KIW84_050795 [Lathyrus oleraceus]|uniref:Uncharacterized protein n=1 Tax=Pisum sativum TaxID=3888 RepID=A0A9D4WM89_PEA|nr:hypothetical protein KIW84_050795 [Pisum sativum]
MRISKVLLLWLPTVFLLLLLKVFSFGPNGVPLAAPVSVLHAVPDGVTPPPNGFPLVAPVGVHPPPDDICHPPPDGSPLTAPNGVPPHPPPNDLPLVASDDLHLRCSLVALNGVPLAAPFSVYLAVPDGVTPPPNDFPLVAPVGVPPPPDDIRHPPPDGSPLTAPDGVPPPPPPNDLPLVASDDLHLRTLMAQRQQRAAPFVFTPQLELDQKHGVYRHNSHSKKWTRIFADEDFRFPPDTKTEVLRGGTPRGVPLAALEGVSPVAPDGVPLAALEGVSLVAPNGVPLAAPVSVSLAVPDGVTPPPNGFPLVAPVGVPPPPDDIRPPPPDGSPLTAPDGVPPPPPPNDLPLVASDDHHLRCSLVAPDGVPLAAPVSVSLAAPDGVTPSPNCFPLVAPVGVPPPPDDIRPPPPDGSPLTALDGVPPPPPPNDLPLVASDDLHLRTLMAQRQQRAAPFVFTPQLELDLKRGIYRHNSHSKKWTRIIAEEDFRFPPDTKTEVLWQKWRRMRKDDPKLSIILSGPSRLADEMLGLGGTLGGVPLAALKDVSLVAPVGVPPPPDDICPLPPDGSPLTAPDGFPPPPPPNDLPLVASDDLHLSHSKKWTRIIADEDFRFPQDTKTEVLRQKWRRMRKDDPKLSILLSGPSRLADEMLGLGGTPGGVPLGALEGVSLVAPVGVPPPPDGSPLTAPDRFPPPPPPNDLPLVASDDLHLRTLMAQRQQRAAPFVFTPQLELDLKRGVYRHNSHSNKWTRIIADEDFRFPPNTKTEVLWQKWRRMCKDDPKLSIILSGPSRLADEMLGLGGTPGGVPLAALKDVSLVAPVGVPPPPDDICPPPPDGSPLTAPDGFPPPPPPNDLPLVASDDLHLRTLMAQRQQRAAPFVFTLQLELDLKRGVYRHNSHSKKWTRIIADEDFRFPQDTKTEVLRQKWRRMRKDDPKLSIILSGPSRLADEMLGLGGTPGAVPLAALKDVSLVAPVGVPPPPDDICPLPPDGSPLTAPDGFPPPPPPNDLPLVASDDLHLSHSKKWTRIIADEDFRFPQDTKTEVLRQKWRRMRKDDPKLSILLSGPSRLADEMLGLGGTPGGVPLAALEGVSLVAPVGVPPPPNDIYPPPPDGCPLTAPDRFPPPPPPNDLPLVASDDLHLRTLMAQRQQRAAPFVFTPQLELDLKRGVYRHNSHSNKWTRIIADEDFRFPPNTKTEVLWQKWRRMCKDDPKLSIILSGPSRLADEMLGLGGTPGGVPLAALKDVSLVAPVGVPPPPDDICPPPPDGSPLTAPDGFPPPPPPNDLPLVASDDLHLRTLMAQRQQRAAPFVFTLQLELDLKRGVYRHNSHSKKWTRIIADEDFRFPQDTKTEVLRQKWRRMRKDDPKFSIILS